MTQANLQGIPTGPVPLGYKKVRIGGKMRVILDENTALLICEVFHLASEKRTSLRSIVSTISSKGLVSQRGTPLSAMALWRILSNPFYFGQIQYGGKVFEGTHEPIITRAEFNHVQEHLAFRRRR